MFWQHFYISVTRSSPNSGRERSDNSSTASPDFEKSMEINEKSMEIKGNAWKSMEMYENQLKCIVSPEINEESMQKSGFRLNADDIYDISHHR